MTRKHKDQVLRLLHALPKFCKHKAVNVTTVEGVGADTINARIAYTCNDCGHMVLTLKQRGDEIVTSLERLTPSAPHARIPINRRADG